MYCTCVFHKLAKLLLNQRGLDKLLGLKVVRLAHRLVARVEVSQQQQLLPLISVDLDCFQKGQPGQVGIRSGSFNLKICKPDLI